MKDKRLAILLGSIVLSSAVFLLLNFRVAVSSNQSAKLVFTTDSGDNIPTPMQGNNKINMLLVGEGPLVRTVQKTLTKQMNESGLGEIELVQELELASQSPVLIIKVGRPDPFWTPFFAMSKVPIHAGYASNGDMTFMEIAEATHTSVAGPDHSVLNMYAEYEVNDRSLGLISRVGYHQFLADYLAQEIVTVLKALYQT